MGASPPVGKPWTLGFDPATCGAATLLGPSGVTAVWAWRDRQRGGERCFEVVLVWLDAEGEWQSTVRMRPTLTAVGDLIATQAARFVGQLRFRVWSEASYVHGGTSKGTAIRMGWITGAVVGPAQRYAHGRKVGEVQSVTWRSQLLSMAGKREDVKAASLKYMPARLPGLSEALRIVSDRYNVAIKELDHITDSGGVAEYGQRQKDDIPPVKKRPKKKGR